MIHGRHCRESSQHEIIKLASSNVEFEVSRASDRAQCNVGQRSGFGVRRMCSDVDDAVLARKVRR